MIAGQTVSVQNLMTKRWDERGIIVKAHNPRNRTFQVKINSTIWTRSKLFLRPVHIPLTDPSHAIAGARVQERKARKTGTVNAIFTAPLAPEEEKKNLFCPPPPAREEKKKRQPPTCSSRQLQAAPALMGLPKTLTSQFIFFQQDNSKYILFKQDRIIMIVTIPSLIAARIATRIATAVITGGITGTVVYLTSGDADVATGDQFKAAHP
jgi:hypothetical protein